MIVHTAQQLKFNDKISARFALTNEIPYKDLMGELLGAIQCMLENKAMHSCISELI